jgi:hypothetical protein
MAERPYRDILIRCPTTGTVVRTGLNTGMVQFCSLAGLPFSVVCGACSKTHRWSQPHAWLIRPIRRLRRASSSGRKRKEIPRRLRLWAPGVERLQRSACLRPQVVCRRRLRSLNRHGTVETLRSTRGVTSMSSTSTSLQVVFPGIPFVQRQSLKPRRP